MNRHEMIFNMINDECYFTSNHCDHDETFFLSSRSSISQKLFNSDKQSNRTFYLSFFERFFTSSFFTSVQKYQIFQKRSVSISSRSISSRSIVENWIEKKSSLREFLNFDFKYVIEKIDKNYFSSKFFKKKQKVKTIRETQKSNLINVSIKKFDLFKKFTRRFSRKFKITIFEHENDEQNFDFDVSLNVVFVDAIAFQSITKFKKKRKKIKTFFLIMKKLDEIIDNVKKNLVKIETDLDLNLKKIFKIMKTIVEKLKRKIFEFFKRFESVFNSKKIDKLFSHRFYDHKIELTKNSN